MTIMSWTVPAALGAYHGLNPAMGWLFAVALGLQERRAAAVLRALPAIALGHAASVMLVLGLVMSAALVVPVQALRLAGAAALFGFAAYLLVRRNKHPRWVGMRVGFREVVLWSFLMATAHRAGLMLFPLLVASSHHPHAAHAAAGGGFGVLGIHTLAMFAAMTAAALITFYVVGVNFLRRAWINLDALWIGALVIAGLVS